MDFLRSERLSLDKAPCETYGDYAKHIRKENREYLDKMKNILVAPRKGLIKGSVAPGELLDYLFIGNQQEARNARLLKRLRITHVLNCAAAPGVDEAEGSALYDVEKTGVRSYHQFEARDNDGYPILRRHFWAAKRFIDSARDSGGRALVHCELGVNRSGAICIAYLMLDQDMTLLQTLRLVKMERPVVLVNEGFQKELIEFARDHDKLYKHSGAGVL